jgi:hypothetical protein
VAISAGDFVRNVKQLIDLLRQLGEVLADPRSAQSARQAAEALFRGVVAASSMVAVADAEADADADVDVAAGTGTGDGGPAPA